jgi:hypothetical protein
MWVEFKPEDPAKSGDPFRVEYDATRVLGSHAEMIERRFGGTWEQFNIAVVRGGMKARRLLLWYFRMREHAGYRLEDLPDFYAGELEVSFSVAELTGMRESAVKAPLDDEDEREQLLMGLDVAITEAIALEEKTRADQEPALAEAAEEEDGGKARWPDDASVTG